jgi:hypothetical protein
MPRELSSRILNTNIPRVQVVSTDSRGTNSSGTVKLTNHRSTKASASPQSSLGDRVAENVLLARGYILQGTWLVKYHPPRKYLFGLITIGWNNGPADVYVQTDDRDGQGNRIYRKPGRGEVYRKPGRG